MTQRPTMPYWEDLVKLPVLSESQACNLVIDGDGTRVWIARTGLEDGEPFEHTVYVEISNESTGGWMELGHYDGDDPPFGLPGITPHGLRGLVEIRYVDWDAS